MAKPNGILHWLKIEFRRRAKTRRMRFLCGEVDIGVGERTAIFGE